MFRHRTLIWLGGRWSVVLFAFPPVAIELYHGNIHLFMAAAIVLGFRYPAAWAFVLLTKPTSGIGLLWFLARGEWRALATAAVTTVVIVLVTLVVAPALWVEWLAYVMARPAGMPGGPSVSIPLPVRLTIAAGVVLWGARTDRAWTVPVAATIALPVLWYAGFSVLVAAVPGLRAAARVRRDGESGSVPTERPLEVHTVTIGGHASGSAP